MSQTKEQAMQGKRLGSVAAAVLLAAAALPAAHGQQQGPVRYYGAAHVGQNTLSDWGANVNFGGVNSPGSLKLDRGLHFGLMAGRQKDNTRVEVEYQRGRVNIESMSLGPVTQATDASGHYQALTLNGYGVWKLADSFNGFLGLGVGWGSVKLPGLPSISGCNCFRQSSDDGFVWQLRVGAEYDIAAERQLFAQYTYLRLPKSNSGGTPGVSYSSKSVGALTVGLRSGF
jgi:opacity protein-like surface antigen